MTSRPAATVTTGQTASDLRPWWQIAVIAAVAAAIGNLLVYLIAVGLFDADVRVPEAPGSATYVDLSVVQVLFASIVPAILATLLAIALLRWTGAPRRWFVISAVVIFLLSFLSFVDLDASTGAYMTLALMHLVAAVAITMVVAPRLPSTTR